MEVDVTAANIFYFLVLINKTCLSWKMTKIYLLANILNYCFLIFRNCFRSLNYPIDQRLAIYDPRIEYHLLKVQKCVCKIILAANISEAEALLLNLFIPNAIEVLCILRDPKMMYMQVSQNLNYIIFLAEELSFQNTEIQLMPCHLLHLGMPLLCSYSDGSERKTPK